MTCLQGPVGRLDNGPTAMSLNKNQDKRHHHQAGDKRKHPSDDESCDDDDRLSVTAGHDFDVTVDGEDELSLYSNEVEKGGYTPEGQLHESRYHDLLSVVEDDLDSPIEQQFPEVCQKFWGNSTNNDKFKAELKSILVPKNCTFMKIPYLKIELDR